MKREVRTWRNIEIRVSGDGEPPKISGHAAVFDSPSEDLGWCQELREEIDPHAFDGVLADQPDVRGLFNHDDNLVLGRTISGTLRLSVDAIGLFYEIDPPDTQFARDLMVSMRRGDISGSSFAFTCKRDQWTDNPDGSVTRRILEFDSLYDVSPVTYPAYPASSSEARSLPASMPAEMRQRFERRGEGDCSCQCPECLAGDCASCSDPDCDDPSCLQERSLHDGQADENLRLRIRLAQQL